ncbi:AAA family ATPase [Amycolatopsis sp. NPDC004368]
MTIQAEKITVPLDPSETPISHDAALPFIGRHAEKAQLEQMLSASINGGGGGLVVRGPAGIGKTALLEAVADSIPDLRVVRVRGMAAEADLPYSALQLLCSALATELSMLEYHQREALETVVALRAGATPDRLLLCVAVVELLSLAARTKPLLCLVDDLHWIDRMSAEVFGFAVERLERVPAVLAFADQGEHMCSLPALTLGGLVHADARHLLESALPAPLDPHVVERIVAEARGNPTVLLSVARDPVEVGGGYGVRPYAVPEHDVVSRLAPESRCLLIIASADPLGDPARLWRAASWLGIPAEAAAPLESEGLLSFGVWVTFRDPRLRAAVYGLASTEQRRTAHRALAFAVSRSAEPDRHAWHRAHAQVEPDDTIADELVRAAGAAHRRGGIAAEAAFLELAAARTAEPTLRTRRAISAAEAHHTAGATDAAARLLASAELGPADAVTTANAKRVRARISFDASRHRSAITQLVEAAQELEQFDERLARPAYLEALGSATFTGHLDLVRAVLARLAEQQPDGPDRLLEGVAQRCTSGYAASVEPLKLALKTLDCDHGDEPRARLLGCLVAPDLWDDNAWHDLTKNELARARRDGARRILPYVLTHRALVEIHTGHFDAAQALVTEARTISEAGGTPPFPHATDVLTAWRGRPVGTGPHRGEGMARVIAHYAKAVLSNGLGNYEDAVAATRWALEGDGLELRGWSLAELVEAASRTGDLVTAEAALDRLSESTCLSGTEWALGVEARSRALLLDGTSAEDLYIEAIDRLSRTRIAAHTARAQLVYGEWLRRQGRRIHAREALRAAHDAFAGMGAEAFAERAGRELLATGERARRRVPETRSQLTPQEVRIAVLARDGRSNPEIATALSISPRTVEYHLHKVFTKLSIRSRTKLHLVLGDDHE